MPTKFLTVLLGVVLAALVLGGAAACGGDEDEGAAGTTTAAPTEEREPVRAGLVSDVGRFNDRSFNQSALEGLNRARDELGAEVRAVESRAAGDYVPNLSTLARQGYDITIGVGFLLAEGVAAVAKQFPNSNFAIIDYSINAPPFNGDAPNVRGLTFATNENSYMIGCLASLMVERQGGRQVISAVGGIRLPTVDIFIAGYRAGARKCTPTSRS